MPDTVHTFIWIDRTLTDKSIRVLLQCFTADIPTDTNQGGCIRYGVHADDGTDFLSLNGMVTFSAVNIAGTESCDVQEVANNQSEVSPGAGDSLSVSFTCATM